MALRSFLRNRSLRFKVIASILVVTLISMFYLVAMQFILSSVLQRSNNSYSLIKSSKLIGQALTGIANLEAALDICKVTLANNQSPSSDDLEIAGEEIRAGTINLIGSISELHNDNLSINKMQAAFDNLDKVIASTVALVSEKKVKQEGLQELKASVKELFRGIKELEGKVLESGIEDFLFVQKAERLNTLIQFICIIILLLCLLWSILLMKSTMYRFESSLTSVHAATTDLQTSSKSLVEQSTSLADLATSGAAAVQETVATLDEISAMVQRTKEIVDRTTNASSMNVMIAEKGKNTVREASDSMVAMQGAIDRFSSEVAKQNERLTEVVNVIQGIADKTKVIDDIVFQTRLLSFNASVEAASAGEHGRGFSVVAGEIGNLATMSGGAAKDISTMVVSGVASVAQLIQTSREIFADLAVDATNRASKTVEHMKASAQAFESITSAIKEVSALNQEILSASSEQSLGVNNISIAMKDVNLTIATSATNASITVQTATNFGAVSAGIDEDVVQMQKQVFGANFQHKESR